MENKPKFCSECGAQLTGSAAFCPECGAKQQLAPAPAPAPEPAPENSLAAPKAKLNVFGLIVAVLALGVTLIAIILTVVQMTVLYGKDMSNIGLPLLRQNALGMVTSLVAPLAAAVLVFVKNKKLALVGLLVALGSLLLQFLIAVFYVIAARGNMPLARLSFIFRPVNGESLFMDLWRLFRVGANTGRQSLQILLSLGASMFYFLKNMLAASACLIVAAKKKEK